MTAPVVRFDDTTMSRARWVASTAGGLVMLAGASALAGWIFDVELLKGFHAGITMKANAAVSLLLAGASLWILRLEGRPALQRLGQAAALISGSIGAATLSQHVFGWDLGIDQLLFTEEPGAVATASPGRMGPPASACFTLAGTALLLLYRRRHVTLAQWAALAIGLVTLLSITGYAYSVETLYGVARYTGIALHTAAALLVLSIGLLAVSIDSGFAAVVAGVGAGSVMARRLLGFAVIMPLTLGAVRLWLEEAGFFGARFGVTVLILSIIVILAALIVRTALRLNRMEQKQLAAEAKLRDRLQELETVMEVLPIGLFIAADPSASQITANRAAREFLRMRSTGENVSLSAPQGSAPVHFRVFQNGSELAPEDLPVQRAARDGVAIHETELDVVFADGTVRHELISALPLLDAHGRPRGAVAAILDNTTRRTAEREREELLARERTARAEAEAANRAKDEFLATISHELRTPLNAILGWASMLGDGTVLDEAAVRLALATIERSCKAQAQLIDDLLDVSRIRAGMLRLDLRPIDFRAVVTAAADVVRPAADAREIELHTLLPDTPCLVRGDAARLQQVVWNLLSNAVKFNSRGGSVDVRLSATARDAVLTVTDIGEGIDPDFLPFVFERFTQAEAGKTRRHGGLGLGLSIAHHLVEMHGGAIAAASDGRGQGATFTVHLPQLVSLSEALPPPSSEDTAVTSLPLP